MDELREQAKKEIHDCVMAHLMHGALALGYEDRILSLPALKKLIEENKALREWVWLNHGHPLSAMYGDDGERQCHACNTDFKRVPMEKIIEVLKEMMKKETDVDKFINACRLNPVHGYVTCLNCFFRLTCAKKKTEGSGCKDCEVKDGD